MSLAVASLSPAGPSGLGRVHSLSLPGPAGRLEALLNEGAPDAKFAAVVCHPHPLGGGSMHNKVVYHAMKTFNAPEWGRSWPVLRFNFRGAGLSEGKYDGDAEWEDVVVALEWLTGTFRLPVIAAGFSFGAVMMLKASCEHKACLGTVLGAAAIGLPTQARGIHYTYEFLKDCTLPKLFVSGDRDSFAPADEWRRVTAEASDPKTQVLIAGADHFFTGQLEPMQHALSSWLTEQFQ